jgi:putative GTP pyrophosphokinase
MERQENEPLSIFETDTLDAVLQKSRGFIKLMTYYRCAMMEIETKFKVLNEHYSLEHDRNPIQTVKTRLKSPISIREKLQRLGLDMQVSVIEENLHDVAGVRVICSFVEDVYALADALLAQDDITLIEKKDYIRSPKKNGYRSLHLIVSIPIFLASEKKEMQVEIQLRTIAMDTWASLEHQMNYKKENVFPEHLADELFACAELAHALDERMNALHKETSKTK